MVEQQCGLKVAVDQQEWYTVDTSVVRKWRVVVGRTRAEKIGGQMEGGRMEQLHGIGGNSEGNANVGSWGAVNCDRGAKVGCVDTCMGGQLGKIAQPLLTLAVTVTHGVNGRE